MLGQGQIVYQHSTVEQTFKNSFFPSTLNDCFKLDVTLKNFELIAVFKGRLLLFIHPVPSNVCNTFDPIGLKLLARLHLGFSHLN